jgi:hypothetical protein
LLQLKIAITKWINYNYLRHEQGKRMIVALQIIWGKNSDNVCVKTITQPRKKQTKRLWQKEKQI